MNKKWSVNLNMRMIQNMNGTYLLSELPVHHDVYNGLVRLQRAGHVTDFLYNANQTSEKHYYTVYIFTKPDFFE